MRALLTLAAVSLFTIVSCFAQQAQRTPPGGDMVGSDRPVTPNDVRTEPTPSPDANQRMTERTGSTTGYESTPAFSGASRYGTARAQQSPGTTGDEGQTAATAGRRRSHRKDSAASMSSATTSKPGRAHARRTGAHRKHRKAPAQTSARPTPPPQP